MPEVTIREKTIRLPGELFDSLYRHAQKRGIAMSALINNILWDANIKLNDQDAAGSVTDTTKDFGNSQQTG